MTEDSSPDEVEVLIDTIREYDETHTNSSEIERLTNIGKTAVPRLTRALEDKDGYIRRVSAIILGNIGAGNPENWDPGAGFEGNAIEKLIRHLDDIDYEVIMASAEALGKIGNKCAVKHLTWLVKDERPFVSPGKEVKQAAANALAMLGHEVE